MTKWSTKKSLLAIAFVTTLLIGAVLLYRPPEPTPPVPELDGRLEFEIDLAQPYTNRTEQMVVAVSVTNTSSSFLVMDLSKIMVCMVLDSEPDSGYRYGHMAQTNNFITIPPYGMTNVVLTTEELGDYGRYTYNAKYWASHKTGMHTLWMIYFAPEKPVAHAMWATSDLNELFSINNKEVHIE